MFGNHCSQERRTNRFGIKPTQRVGLVHVTPGIARRDNPPWHFGFRSGQLTRSPGDLPTGAGFSSRGWLSCSGPV